MRKLKLPIPTTIITGSLGVGKTTALCSLISRKPAGQHWCIIVNEFGAVGIDAVTLQSTAAATAEGTVVVKQIAGGCMCCAQSGVLLPAVAQIIRQTKPDRLLIEPSGLGHPAGLLDILQGPHLSSALQLNAIICLVDISCFVPRQLAGNPTAWDQITVADILVGSKADAAACEAVETFQHWAQEELFPPKSQVLVAAHGQLDVACLDQPRALTAAAGLLLRTQQHSSRARQQQMRSSMWQQSVSQQHSQLSSVPQHEQASVKGGQQGLTVPGTETSVSVEQAAVDNKPQPGRPHRVLGQQLGAKLSTESGWEDRLVEQHMSCGWVFNEADVFQQDNLLQLLQLLTPVVARVKGVFRAGQKLWLIPTTANAGQPPAQGLQGPLDVAADKSSTCCRNLQLQEVCYRGPSMVEVILASEASQLQQAAAAVVDTVTRWSGMVDVQTRQRSSSADNVLCDGSQRMPQPAAASCSSAGGGSVSRVLKTSTLTSHSNMDVWLVLEQAFLSCIAPSLQADS